MPTKAELSDENNRLRSALEEIDDQRNGWYWLSGPESARIAMRGLRRHWCGLYGPGSILHNEHRTNWCLVNDDGEIILGSEMDKRPTEDEIRQLRKLTVSTPAPEPAP